MHAPLEHMCNGKSAQRPPERDREMIYANDKKQKTDIITEISAAG